MTLATFDVGNFVQDVNPSASVGGAIYDATDAKGKRREPAIDRRSEDGILDSFKRSKLLANSRDIQRNYAIAAWAIRRHLDYVASFGFQCQTSDRGFNSEVEAMLAEEETAENCDIAGRHRLGKMLRLLEARATLDGDCGWLLIDNDGGKLQGIQGDRIRNPEAGQTESGEWTHGVRLGEGGKAIEYAIHKRKPSGGMEFERKVPATAMILRGYFDFFDQVRGISPLASGLNTMRDTYENFDYALAKAKVSQLLGFKVTRGGTTALAPTESEDGDEDSDQPKYKIDFGAGPVFLDMDPGEDAGFITADTPSNEFREYMMLAIMVSLKALDIPYSFFDESHTNFFGSRGAWMHYARSARDKIEDNRACLNRYSQFKLAIKLRDRQLTFPRKLGLTLARPFWSWVPRGMPWWKPTEEIAGHLSAIGAGLDNPQRVAEEADRGDVFENIDKTAEVLAYAADKWKPYGMNLSFVPQEQKTQVVKAEDLEANNAGKTNGGKA